MIDRGHDLPLGRQAELLRLSRSSIYYEPRAVASAELAIMRQIDELVRQEAGVFRPVEVRPR
jgi:putative transposase